MPRRQGSIPRTQGQGSDKTSPGSFICSYLVSVWTQATVKTKLRNNHCYWAGGLPLAPGTRTIDFSQWELPGYPLSNPGMFCFNSRSHHGSWWCYISVSELQTVNSEPEIAFFTPLSGSWYHGCPFSFCMTPWSRNSWSWTHEWTSEDLWDYIPSCMYMQRRTFYGKTVYSFPQQADVWWDGLLQKRKRHSLGNNSVNKPFLQCNPTCGKRKHVALQAYCSCLTEFIGGHLGSQTGKAGIVVWICDYYDDPTLLSNEAIHCITTCQLVTRLTYFHFYESCFIW